MGTSKTIRHLLTVILLTTSFGIILTSCKKKGNNDDMDDNSPFTTKPEAIAAEDSGSGGVYKGVLVGSTGYVKIILQGGQKSVTVTMDGTTKSLTEVSFAPTNWTSGQPITRAVFAKDNWQVVFSVAANGGNPVIEVDIPGHSNITVAVLKETSTSVVKSYEGTVTYQGTSANSVFNFVVKGNSFSGLVRIPGETATYTMQGSLQNGTTLQGTVNGATVNGTIQGDNATGNIITPNTSAPWTAKRTL
ncbi:hypothetical protein [Pedobacter nanyangensis]|uniref:hypothetical protein n=1 Tax=Pedobacter nanyangensis TaxID=1562389 RepID=UPI000DE3D73C|nr:hypothetical protein [Pedobacter nanyangensis]